MWARWRPCSTTSGELSRRCCVNKKENAERVANYLQTMGIIWRVLSPARKYANITAEKVNQPHRQESRPWLLLAQCVRKKCLFFCIFRDVGSFSCGTVSRELSLKGCVLP